METNRYEVEALAAEKAALSAHSAKMIATLDRFIAVALAKKVEVSRTMRIDRAGEIYVLITAFLPNVDGGESLKVMYQAGSNDVEPSLTLANDEDDLYIALPTLGFAFSAFMAHLDTMTGHGITGDDCIDSK
jgi:hypothetical protein